MITTVVITGVMLALHGGQLRQGLHSVTVTLFASAWSDREGCKRWRGTSLDSTSDRRGIAEHMPEMPGSTAGSELFRGQLVDAMASLDRDRLVPVARRGRSGGVSSCLISVVAAAQLVCVCVCVCRLLVVSEFDLLPLGHVLSQRLRRLRSCSSPCRTAFFWLCQAVSQFAIVARQFLKWGS